MVNPQKTSEEFAALFRQMEYALKRSGYLRNKEHAEADWSAFAATLGDGFFDKVMESGIAATLVGYPPRKLLADGLAWHPEQPAPLLNVTELFVQGVCRVRNSYIHGEKFVGSGDSGQWRRDTTLIEEALAVLKLASQHAAPAEKK